MHYCVFNLDDNANGTNYLFGTRWCPQTQHDALRIFELIEASWISSDQSRLLKRSSIAFFFRFLRVDGSCRLLLDGFGAEV